MATQQDAREVYEGRDKVNAPWHYGDRASSYRCPGCDRRLKYHVEDRLWYCKACEQEYTAQDLGV